ncbi:DMT family transporter [Mangrovimonas sp. DI 80]|uniref:DMT family transporter n=1 Tax=Mangrovimonas sp. DI 80 TaxID=1779330 RepID=UPI000977D158|nr:DMT family transporter [Mangrovimonas sp. DI 80]OMP32747.1 EamA family transporter [Mangrovimonas sp. DI 80]
MPNAKLKHYLQLHFLVFIAGFTAILGELISVGAMDLVWYRMVIASILIFGYMKYKKLGMRLRPKVLLQFVLAGIIIALHWITFFEAINQSNVSITLAMFSTGAFFASFIEPMIYKRRIVWYEIIFGLIVVLGVFLISRGELHYINGMILGVISALLSSLFSVLNGVYIKQYDATIISFYEFISGVLFLSVFMLFKGGFNSQFFQISWMDFLYLFILGSICSAYAFIEAVKVMKYISPYTVILSYNLEPVYGIVLAILLFPETEIMGANFYYGVFLVLGTLIFEAILKQRKANKIKR